MATLEESRRDRKRRAAHESIYLAAIALFTERGYSAVSVDEIAESADVSRGTFFNHFPKKEDIISAWSERRREAVKTRFVELSGPIDLRAVDRLRLYFEALALVSEESPAETASMIEAWARNGFAISELPYLASQLEEVVSDGVASGEFGQSVDASMAGLMLRDLYFGALFRWIRDGRFEDGSDRMFLRDDLSRLCDSVIGAMSVTRSGIH